MKNFLDIKYLLDIQGHIVPTCLSTKDGQGKDQQDSLPVDHLTGELKFTFYQAGVRQTDVAFDALLKDHFSLGKSLGALLVTDSHNNTLYEGFGRDRFKKLSALEIAGITAILLISPGIKTILEKTKLTPENNGQRIIIPQTYIKNVNGKVLWKLRSLLNFE